MGKYTDLEKDHRKQGGGTKYFWQWGIDCYFHIDREEAEKKLKDKTIGTFLLRDSSVKGGTYLVISRVTDNGIDHELIGIRTSFLTPGHPQARFVTSVAEYIDNNYDTSKALINSRFNQNSSEKKNDPETQENGFKP